MTQIYSCSDIDKLGIEIGDLPGNSLWFPEIEHSSPITARLPKHIIELCPHMVGRVIVTVSEYIILWFLREIREGRMKPDEVQLFCNLEQIQIDETGELIDKWPGGFYRERASLLF